jgi:aspartokinase
MVSVVGREALAQPGLFRTVLDTLAEEQVPVLQTGDADFSLSVLIPESELRRTVSALHARFGLATKGA